MGCCIKMEMKKLADNSLFWICLGLGFIFVLMSVFYTWQLYYSELGSGGMLAMLESSNTESKENILAMQTLYNSWIGADKQSLGATMFYILAPLMSALPFGWCFSEELHSGYLHVVVPCSGRESYFTTKMLVSFLGGGMILVLPQLFSILLTAMYIPATKQSVIYSPYTAIIHGDMFAKLFYTHPLGYIMMVLVIDFVFGGLFAWLSLATAFFVHSRLITVIAPLLILLLADSAKTSLYYISYIEISPLNLLHPMSAPNYVKGWIVIIWLFLLSIITSSIILIRGCKREIF